MQQLEGQPAEVMFTITITRANGEEKTIEMVGFTDPVKLQQFMEEKEHGNHPQHSRA